jgi:quinol monooxygenase YgiN
MSLSAENIVVIVDVRAKPGHEVDVRKALEAAVLDTRPKDGCVLFRIQEDLATPGHLVVYEVWRDLAAIDAHQTSAQFYALLEAAKPLTDGAQLFRLKAVAE